MHLFVLVILFINSASTRPLEDGFEITDPTRGQEKVAESFTFCMLWLGALIILPVITFICCCCFLVRNGSSLKFQAAKEAVETMFQNRSLPLTNLVLFQKN